MYFQMLVMNFKSNLFENSKLNSKFFNLLSALLHERMDNKNKNLIRINTRYGVECKEDQKIIYCHSLNSFTQKKKGLTVLSSEKLSSYGQCI